MQGTMMEADLTVTQLFERAVRLFGDREITSRLPDRSLFSYRYADLGRRVRSLAAALLHAGLRPGERVATLMFNHSVHLEAYFGIPLAGGILHTLNPRLPIEQLAFIANDAADRFIIVDEALVPLLEHWRARSPIERVFVVQSKTRLAAHEAYEDLLLTAPEDVAFPVAHERDACGLCYTSGTTGNPRGVLYTHRSTVLHTLGISLPDCLGLGHRDTVVPVVPMFHVNAWGLPYAAIMVGARLVLPGPHLDPETLLDLFQRVQPTLTAGVPSIWMGVLEALERQPRRWSLPRMRMVVGGSAPSQALIRGLDRHGQEVVHGWGMTETSPMGTVNAIKEHLADLPEHELYHYRGSQGLPVPLLDARIVGEDGEMPHDGRAMGELQVRGPWVAGSYFGAVGPEVADIDRFTSDGWLRTGDVATIDDEGYVYIVDRIKDLVKSGGEWISSVHLENALMDHYAVREACVIAVPHEHWGERPLAVVVLQAGATVNGEQLRAHLGPRFPKWWLPDAFEFVDSIPKSATGKFAKLALREQFPTWRWESSPPAPCSQPNDVIERRAGRRARVAG
jgi:fatty-acyl-CoA synthase